MRVSCSGGAWEGQWPVCDELRWRQLSTPRGKPSVLNQDDGLENLQAAGERAGSRNDL